MILNVQDLRTLRVFFKLLLMLMLPLFDFPLFFAFFFFFLRGGLNASENFIPN